MSAKWEFWDIPSKRWAEYRERDRTRLEAAFQDLKKPEVKVDVGDGKFKVVFETVSVTHPMCQTDAKGVRRAVRRSDVTPGGTTTSSGGGGNASKVTPPKEQTTGGTSTSSGGGGGGTPAKWEFWDTPSKRWAEYRERDRTRLEAAFQDPKKPEVKIDVGDGKFKVVFETVSVTHPMCQTDAKGVRRAVRRSDVNPGGTTTSSGGGGGGNASKVTPPKEQTHTGGTSTSSGGGGGGGASSVGGGGSASKVTPPKEQTHTGGTSPSGGGGGGGGSVSTATHVSHANPPNIGVNVGGNIICKGEFKEGQDGGHMSVANPQFRLTVPSGGQVTIIQKLDKVDSGWGKCCIFAVLDSGDLKGDHVTSLKGTKEIGKSKFLPTDSVSADITLPSKGSYTILCCSPTHAPKDAGVEKNQHIHAGSMTLTVKNAPSGTKLEEVKPKGSTLHHKLAFKGPGCAGYGSSKNPQFFLTIKKKSAANFTMKISIPTPKIAIRMFLQKLQGDNPPNVRLISFDPTGRSGYYQESTYLSSGSVSMCSNKDLEPGNYCILTMTDNKEPREVTLDVLVKSDPDCTLTGQECPDEMKLQQEEFSSITSTGKCTKDMDKVSNLNYAYSIDDAHHIVDKVTAECKKKSTKESACLWKDPHFLHNARSLNESSSRKSVGDGAKTKWKRLHEIVERPALFTAGIEASDIAQGSLGNCWFCACVSAIGTRPDKVTKLFYPATYNPAGIYSISVWNGFEWFAILIDDALPCGESGMQCFARGFDKSEFWFPLIEKAVAKLVGCYQNLMGSRSEALGSPRVMELLTGGKATVLYANPEKPEWFPTLREYLGKHWICTTGSEDGCKNGISPNHGYTVLTVYESPDGKLQLIRLRNTWGRGEWRGAYGDDDPIWTKDKALAKACDMEKGAIEDGIFWMTRKDFEDNFEIMNFCAFPSDDFKNEKILDKLSFNDKAAATKPNINILQNDQILFSCPAGTEVNVRLRFSGSDVRSNYHHFYIFPVPQGDESSKNNLALPATDAYFTSKSMTRETTGQVKLPRTSSHFIIVPCKSHPSNNCEDSGEYKVVIQSSAVISSMAKLGTGFTSSVCHGVCRDNGYNATDSPCWKVTVSKPCKFATIALTHEGECQGLQLLMGGLLYKDKRPEGANVVAETQYLSGHTIDLRFGAGTASDTPLKAGVYLLWLRMQKGKGGDKLTISTASDQEISVTPLR